MNLEKTHNKLSKVEELLIRSLPRKIVDLPPYMLEAKDRSAILEDFKFLPLRFHSNPYPEGSSIIYYGNQKFQDQTFRADLGVYISDLGIEVFTKKFPLLDEEFEMEIARDNCIYLYIYNEGSKFEAGCYRAFAGFIGSSVRLVHRLYPEMAPAFYTVKDSIRATVSSFPRFLNALNQLGKKYSGL